jgi:phytoene dehydrogenase-like protein
MPMTDAIIIGGGHNGLTCASYLAKAGYNVLVLEAAQQAGGAAATREFADGFSVSSGAHLLTMLSDRVSRDLALEQHGLAFAARDLKTVGLADDGAHVIVDGLNVHGVGAADQSAFARFCTQNQRFTRVLANAFARKPPRLVERRLEDNLSLLKLGWDIRTLGKEDMQDLLRMGLINIYDVANEAFESELLKAMVALDGVLGSQMGPRSPNTVLGYLYRHIGTQFGFAGPAVPAGGMGSVSAAFAAAAAAAGAEIRTGARVARIKLEASRAVGVTLDNGEEIPAAVVISNADPKTTFEKLVGLPNLDAGFARRVHTLRADGNAAKLHLALDGLPEFTGLAAENAGDRLLLAPDMQYIELAFNHVKYGECSERPAMEITLPSVHDGSLAPAGKHVLSAIVQYAPYRLKEGWDGTREAFRERVIDRIADYAPGIREQIVASELLTPADLEAEFGMYGGHWHHGEIAVDQIMMMRPMPGANQYATPVDDLYLCGAGAHPGGGIMGLAGRNAAQAVIKGRKAA